MIQFFYPLRGLDGPLTKLQDSIDAAFKRLLKLVPIADGVLLESVTVSATATEVAHGLGRVPRGFLLIKSTVPLTVYQASPSAFPDSNLRLTASGTDVVSLWVF